MTDQEIEQAESDIDKMTQEDMCRLWRFAPSGHPYFSREFPIYEYFKARFDELGGFTPAISKRIGLGL